MMENLINIKNSNKLVLVFNDSGDQEQRLNSINNPYVMYKYNDMPLANLANNVDLLNELTYVERIDLRHIITVGRFPYDDENFSRSVMVDGKDGKGLMCGFDFKPYRDFEGHFTEDKFTFVTLQTLGEDAPCHRTYISNMPYADTFKDLPKLDTGIDGSAEEEVYGEDKFNDLVMQMIEYLDNNSNYDEIFGTIFYDYLNGEYVPLDRIKVE